MGPRHCVRRPAVAGRAHRPQVGLVSDPSPKSRGLMSLFRRTEAPPPPATGDPTAEPSVAGPLDGDAGAEPPAEPPKKQSWLQRLKAGLTKTSARLSEDIA